MVAGALGNPYLQGAVYAVNVGNTIYCTNRYGGRSYLTIIDATNPASMVVQGTPIDLETSLTGVDTRYYPELQKRFAFVAGTGANKLFVVDVTNPAQMSRVATLTDATAFNSPSNVHVVGAVAYTTAYTPNSHDPSPTSPSGITIVDISNPYAPFVISFTSPVALGLSGTQAFDHLYILGSRGYQTDTSDVGGVYVLQLGGAASGSEGVTAQVDFTALLTPGTPQGPLGPKPTMFSLTIALYAGASIDIRSGPSASSLTSIISPPPGGISVISDPPGPPAVLWTFTWWQLPGTWFVVNLSGTYNVMRMMEWY